MLAAAAATGCRLRLLLLPALSRLSARLGGAACCSRRFDRS